MFLCVPRLLSLDEDKSVPTDLLLLLLGKLMSNSVEFRSLGALCGRFRELLAVLFRLVELELICLNRFDNETKQAFIDLYDKIDADFQVSESSENPSDPVH